MKSDAPTPRVAGLSLRQAALVAGISYLLMPVAFAEFYVFPKLVISGHVDQTVQNIAAHRELFFVAILSHFVTLILDVVIAWALYVLLAPTNHALSLLTAWLRVAYAAIGLAGVDRLVAMLRLVSTPSYRTILGDQQFLAQVQLLWGSFHSSLNLALFGIHLILLGYLICRSGYIPRYVGIVVSLVGVSWVVDILRPYLFPNAPLGFIPALAAGELLLPLWLVIKGWRIQEPANTREQR